MMSLSGRRKSLVDRPGPRWAQKARECQELAAGSEGEKRVGEEAGKTWGPIV